MSLHLDDRQRAMLAEMGVRVWWPHDAPSQALELPDPVPAPVAAPHVTQVVRSGPVANERPDVGLPLHAAIDQMDWAQLQQAVGACQACPMCLGRQTPVFIPPPEQLRCDWFVVGDPPDDAQERAGQPFVEDAGRLLDNMLRAVHVQRAGQVPAASQAISTPTHSAYLSLVLKCRPALPSPPDAAALTACGHYLRREIQLLQPKVILAMGRFAMQLLLQEADPQHRKLPLGKLRGTVWRFQGVPVVVTYPPTYLLRTAEDKARAWQDLCLAADVVDGFTPED